MVTPQPAAEEPRISPPQQQSRPADGRKTVAAGILLQHPAVRDQQQQRVNDFQLRVADWITAFAGSMNFVYIHVLWFAVWMLFIERKPWPALTLIVSLEAIFLSTFVMIGQNRQAAFQQVKADHDYNAQELELKTNTQLTREIHVLTAELYKRYVANAPQQE